MFLLLLINICSRTPSDIKILCKVMFNLPITKNRVSYCIPYCRVFMEVNEGVNWLVIVYC